MKKLIYFIFILISINSFGQKPILKTIAINSFGIEYKTFMGFDGLGNNYYINNNVFSKQNDNQIWEYKNVALGKITSVDYVNPLKIVLFYEDFNSIITLDNQLNEIQKLNLFDIDNTILASKIGMASQNQFWIYNALTQQIMLFDYVNYTSKNIGNPIQENIKYTQSDFNNFYWIDETNNCYTIDIFGKLTLLATIPDFEKIQIITNEKILFLKDDTMYCLNNITKTVYKIEIVEKSLQNFYYKDQILAIFTNQEIKNFKLKLP
ncbi:MAG: hypothetical protein ACOYLT_00005 [Flavobacterium sp.]|jgi:hypothetical protein|uniref:hypothetical protein n=1 Tax=Flavobacterium sp. TaxID=239 RepID=UPI003BC102DC